MATTVKEPATLVNILSVQPGKQQEVIESLQQNIEAVITTLKGWISTRLIASSDGTRVVIHSQWDSPADVEAMRKDPRMQAYFPKVAQLASFESIVGADVVLHQR